MRMTGFILGFLIAFTAIAETADVYDFESRSEEMRIRRSASVPS